MRLNIVVEGDAEETFVREVLALHLGTCNVFVTARKVATSRVQRGGLVSYQKARRDVERWLKSDTEARVSTMFDIYRLPKDFPKRSEPRPAGESPQQWAIRLEQAFAADLNNPRFIPYLQVHEFEALLFSDTEKLSEQVGASRRERIDLQQIRESFETPEHINDSPHTAPSKRLLALFPSYEKPSDGVLTALKIGLDTMRQQCPHFADWLTTLEALGQP